MTHSVRFLLPILCLAASAPAFADDKADVLAANQAFDKAVSSKDINAVDPLWAHDAATTIIHPSSKSPLLGWDAVRKSWVEGTLAHSAS